MYSLIYTINEEKKNERAHVSRDLSSWTALARDHAMFLTSLSVPQTCENNI